MNTTRKGFLASLGALVLAPLLKKEEPKPTFESELRRKFQTGFLASNRILPTGVYSKEFVELYEAKYQWKKNNFK